MLLVLTSLYNTILQERWNNKKLVLPTYRHKFTNHRVIDRSNAEIKPISRFYRLTPDHRYHYEFRAILHPSANHGNHRLMLILYGAKRSCDDLWDFSVGKRTYKSIYAFGYSVLAICSQKLTYDINLHIWDNQDAKYIFLSIQRWINNVYRAKFKQYPLLYIHGTSRGARFAGILCRVLPIQAQILFTYPGHRDAMLIPSAYDVNTQNNLVFNTTYANWLYFDFCYNPIELSVANRTLCPFNNAQDYFYPLPPTFITSLENDPYQNQQYYKHFLQLLSKKALQLGGTLLTYNQTLRWDILKPSEVSPSYMQTNFYPWRSKSHASEWFYEHLIHQEKYRPLSRQHQTCWCMAIDFKYFENMPHITLTWTKKKIQEYSDYARDIRRYEYAFCEEVCGDLMTTHSMVSRNINTTLRWIEEVDQIRRSISASITR